MIQVYLLLIATLYKFMDKPVQVIGKGKNITFQFC